MVAKLTAVYKPFVAFGNILIAGVLIPEMLSRYLS